MKKLFIMALMVMAIPTFALAGAGSDATSNSDAKSESGVVFTQEYGDTNTKSYSWLHTATHLLGNEAIDPGTTKRFEFWESVQKEWTVPELELYDDQTPMFQKFGKPDIKSSGVKFLPENNDNIKLVEKVVIYTGWKETAEGKRYREYVDTKYYVDGKEVQIKEMLREYSIGSEYDGTLSGALAPTLYQAKVETGCRYFVIDSCNIRGVGETDSAGFSLGASSSMIAADDMAYGIAPILGKTTTTTERKEKFALRARAVTLKCLEPITVAE